MCNPLYNTELGIYSKGIGLDQVLMSWGHDEYLYQVLKYNNCKIPDMGLKIIRYHSFYPWHQNDGYDYLCNDRDFEVKEWVRKFK